MAEASAFKIWLSAKTCSPVSCLGRCERAFCSFAGHQTCGAAFYVI